MKKDLDYYYRHAMSINEFLSIYFGKNEFMDKRISHENVKSLFPFIERGNFEDIIENPKLVYTGKIVLVRDCNNKCIPYLTSYEMNMNDSLDDREKLIVELVSAIDKIAHTYNNGLIILENNDSISNNVIGSTSMEINIVDDEIVKINNDGGILFKSPIDIFKFDFLVSNYFDNTCYSRNLSSVSALSKTKDFISINIMNNGRIFIIMYGEIFEVTKLLDIKNFLLKSYYPRKEEDLVSEASDMDLSFLMDYELEQLLKKYKSEKNTKMYYRVKIELHKRKKEHKKANKSYRIEKRKIKMKMEEEE